MGVPFDQQHLDDDPPWLVRHNLPTHRVRGRPPNHPARQDFTLEQIDRIYPWLCRRLKADRAVQTRCAELAPSERAYGLLAYWARKRLLNIDWTTLRNKHTLWKHGQLHPIVYCIDSEDFEAEIERQFPPPTQRTP
ncbi:hypothetical protein IVB18_16155 [Bradyrhizobium sp. 186]|uniref:hypothetical protein n=1 Tax=Bradyrhizobium sp. 186 TaxID=2782654 RepID=UPI002001D878|nr:hypothetical protein [Bradyrhizobium sp. 186]UPK38631.1 hypothetical protein IVB18_16155 [Bradyrhizobium sp. 186]